jgi:hypothetical protein
LGEKLPSLGSIFKIASIKLASLSDPIAFDQFEKLIRLIPSLGRDISHYAPMKIFFIEKRVIAGEENERGKLLHC